MKKHWPWIFSLLLIASWGGNVWYYESQKLEKPIYLEHYYEISTDLLSHMSIYFITNRDSEREPYQFRVNDDIVLNVAQVRTRDERGRLQLREAAVMPVSDQIFRNLENSLRFEQATVYYSDGLVDTVSLGEIIVHPRSQSEYDLEFSFSSSSSNGTGRWGSTVQEDITVASVTHSFPELLSDSIDILVNGKSYVDTTAFPLTLNKGDPLGGSYIFQLDNEDVRRFHAYQLMITMKDEQGHIINVQYINEQPQLYDEHLRSYVRLRKGGEREL
ncbi:hypothetical protein [Marinicrinis lubricantis]|uniref:Uncharacterized protein n=1 Tax=Marinicrinis lubricantis TaxID=2086470 RepID=A0ABW1ISD5_9BACL